MDPQGVDDGSVGHRVGLAARSVECLSAFQRVTGEVGNAYGNLSAIEGQARNGEREE